MIVTAPCVTTSTLQVVSVDGLSFLVDQLNMVEQPLSAFAFLLSERTAGSLPARSSRRLKSAARGARLLGHLGHRRVEILVADLHVLGVGQGPQGEVGADGAGRLGLQLGQEVGLVPARCRQELLQRQMCLSSSR